MLHASPEYIYQALIIESVGGVVCLMDSIRFSQPLELSGWTEHHLWYLWCLLRCVCFCFLFLCERRVGSNLWALPCSNTMPIFVEFVSQQPMFGRVFVVEREE
jgi:hypothetical protein